MSTKRMSTNGSITEGLSVPFGSGEKAADPERTTTPVEETLSRALVIGAALAVFVLLIVVAVMVRVAGLAGF